MLSKKLNRINNSMEGTNWVQLLNETEKKTIPVDLIKEIHLMQDGFPDVVMKLDDLDEETLDLFEHVFSHMDDLDADRIKIIVDANRFQKLITKIVSPLLSVCPPRV